MSRARIFSAAAGQASKNSMTTRFTPAALAVRILAHQAVLERDALMRSLRYDEAAREVYDEPFHGADEADVRP